MNKFRISLKFLHLKLGRNPLKNLKDLKTFRIRCSDELKDVKLSKNVFWVVEEDLGLFLSSDILSEE